MIVLRRNRLVFVIAILILSIAILFFVITAKKLEQNQLLSIKDTYIESSVDNSDWLGHKWIVKQVSNNEKSTVDSYVKKPEQQELVYDINKQPLNQINVNVWIEEEQAVETIQLEDYVLAVVLSEMPWSFHDEALKAQMIAARTYIMYRIEKDGNKHDYHVTNSTQHQVINPIDPASLSKVERERYEHIKQLLKDTTDKVITYDNKLIDALYFSTSNGKTESAEHYFGAELPYLKSVESSWEEQISPSYEQQYTFTYKQFLSQLRDANLITESSSGINISILERSESNRIVKLKVNDSELTAKQLREALGIASTDFKWQLDEKLSVITITTVGYGHGVGMSQWGAEGMAREGYSADQILRHYYTDIEITSL